MSRIIVKNLPKGLKEKDLRDHFSDIGAITECSLRFTDQGVFRRFAFVGFKNEDGAMAAVQRLHHSYLSTSKIEVEPAQNLKEKLEKPAVQKKSKKSRKDKPKNADKFKDVETPSEDLILQTGRLCLRNLPFCCESEDVEKLFSVYGKIDVHLVVDRLTKEKTGMGYVNFEKPEDAMTAYKELDRSLFLGRQLHILPGKAKKEEPSKVAIWTKKTYEKKNPKPKPRNWNTLFVGANAAAEVMAERFKISKSDLILNPGKDSVAARLALGQTQLVLEVRDFLLQNGVALDSFSQADGPRSKTVIIVKHLNAGTTQEALQRIFERYGAVVRIVQPPCGLSAIVEFAEPQEAKIAFENLDSQLLDHIPLFLEWAPLNVFSAPPKKDAGGKKDEAENAQTLTESPANDSTEKTKKKKKSCKFIIKNVPFEATAKDLKKLFSVEHGLKVIRLPKKQSGTGEHRGFAFAEFLTPEQAELAFNAFCHNTRLHDRRLVLEWTSAEENIDQMRKRAADHYEERAKRLKKSDLTAALNTTGQGSGDDDDDDD